MKTIYLGMIFSLFLFSLALSAAESDCIENQDKLAINYLQKVVDSQSGKTSERTVVLWRNGEQVAIQYPDIGVAELWEKTSVGKLRLVRYFETDRRGIEYQPSEINEGRGESDWDLKNQLISKAFISKLNLVSTKKENCIESQHYISSDKTRKLTWVPKQSFFSYLSYRQGELMIEWKLRDLIDSQEVVNQYFSVLSSYQTTDYIDIGDNESDPFFLKMIHLGFVEHGASGFYDAEGNSLDSHHH